jgi:hypothetical protein
MSGLFDKLENELGNRSEEGGISPLDLLDLPDELRKIMREMLRKVTLSHADTHKLVAGWPEKERLTESDLNASLQKLVKQGWLIEMGEGEYKGYRVNLRHKKGSNLSESIWGKIDDVLTTRMGEARKAREEDSTESTGE